MKSDPLRAELLAIYAEVDALLSPYTCDSTTECCDFGLTGREPYPTAVELAEIERAMAAASIDTRPKPRRSLPVASAPRRCPLLSDEGRCRIYASRPFGCRTFFCSRVEGPRRLPTDEIRRLSRRVADLSARYAPRDSGPRPLTRALK